MLIFSKEFDLHLQHVQNVLERLRQAGLTVNNMKCQFAANDILILGFHVQDGLILFGRIQDFGGGKLSCSQKQDSTKGVFRTDCSPKRSHITLRHDSVPVVRIVEKEQTR